MGLMKEVSAMKYKIGFHGYINEGGFSYEIQDRFSRI